MVLPLAKIHDQHYKSLHNHDSKTCWLPRWLSEHPSSPGSKPSFDTKYLYKYSRSWGEKVMRWRWAYRDYTRWIEIWGRTGGTWWSERARSKVWIQRLGNMGCFGNPIVVFGSILCNILYCIVELFSLIHGCRHGWLNHVKTSCTICVIGLSLCSWINIVGIKAFAGISFYALFRVLFKKSSNQDSNASLLWQ